MVASRLPGNRQTRHLLEPASLRGCVCMRVPQAGDNGLLDAAELVRQMCREPYRPDVRGAPLLVGDREAAERLWQRRGRHFTNSATAATCARLAAGEGATQEVQPFPCLEATEEDEMPERPATLDPLTRPCGRRVEAVRCHRGSLDLPVLTCPLGHVDRRRSPCQVAAPAGRRVRHGGACAADGHVTPGRTDHLRFPVVGGADPAIRKGTNEFGGDEAHASSHRHTHRASNGVARPFALELYDFWPMSSRSRCGRMSARRRCPASRRYGA